MKEFIKTSIKDNCICYYKDKDCTILHRQDGPAKEYSNGDKEWYLDGVLHREGGPAIESEFGINAWYINDNIHREDGPAIYYNKRHYLKEWWVNNKRHREDGPAVEHGDGRRLYCLYGKTYSHIKDDEQWGKFIKTLVLV